MAKVKQVKPPVDPQYGQSWYNNPANYQGRVIPQAGAYVEQQAHAQSAWDRAVAGLKANRSQQQIKSGLGQDWSVDPRAQHGAYQSLLQAEGGQLDAQQESNQQRGFFGAGVGNQGIGALNYANAVEQLGFKNQLSDWENQYQTGMADAQRSKQDAMLSSLQGAAGDAVDQNDYTPYGQNDPQNSATPNQPGIGPQRYVPQARRVGNQIRRNRNPSGVYQYRVPGRGGSY